MTLTVSCPTCKTQVIWQKESEHRPFCSKRCQLIDIGEWADENHKISQPIQGSSELNEELLDALEDQLLQQNSFFVDAE